MKTLPAATIRELLRYDAETGKLYWRRRPLAYFSSDRVCAWWNTRYAGTEALSSIDYQGYKRGCILGIPIAAHRAIWVIVYGLEPDSSDHIDGDRANNRLPNLRSVSNAENCRNRGVRSDNTSGVVGVRKKKWRNGTRWQARIFISGKDVSLGYFVDFESAVAARLAAEKAHGFHENHGKRPGFVSEREAA